MNKPNFFIVGAPRCATTALYVYLRAHPNIFMCEPKEPTYFAQDFFSWSPRYPRTLTEYLALFSKARTQQEAVGEASTRYLQSKVAIHNIYRFNPDAKIIVLVRNPIDLVHSSYFQLFYECIEDQSDFETAWHFQEERRSGLFIPRGCSVPEVLQYASLGKLGAHLERLLDIFPSRQVKIIVFEDFIHAPATVYHEVLAFLGVPADKRKHFPIINETETHINTSIAHAVKFPPLPLYHAAMRLKKHLGIRAYGIRKHLLRLNAKRIARPPLREEFRRLLISEFEDDVAKLSGIINRDLSHWLR